MRTRPERGPQQTAHCIQCIPCEFGETGRPLAVRPCEHRHNRRDGLTEKSYVVQLACEEGHRIRWNEERILDVENNSRYRKYRQSTHMACLTNLITQPTLDFSQIDSSIWQTVQDCWVLGGGWLHDSQSRETKNMAMSPVGLGTKTYCADEDQHQFI
jgi:hypothetical protein